MRLMEPLLTDDDLAELLRSTPASLRTERSAARREGRTPNLPPYLKIGGRLRYRAEDVEQWLLSRQVGFEVVR